MWKFIFLEMPMTEIPNIGIPEIYIPDVPEIYSQYYIDIPNPNDIDVPVVFGKALSNTLGIIP